jgi:acyl-CoA synthetase (AMP-forming)/AMP-acid ligase II
MARMAIVPLDPLDPPRRLSHLLDDARPAILVVKDTNSIGDILRMIPGKSDVTVVGMSEVEILCREDRRQIDGDMGVHGEDVSHVYFTSGSTGRLIYVYAHVCMLVCVCMVLRLCAYICRRVPEHAYAYRI